MVVNMKTRSKTFQIASEIPWEPAGEGVRRQVMAYDGQLMLVKVEFQKGAIGSIHAHYHSQASYVAAGVFELTIGDEKLILKPGDGYYVEPDVLHGCVCLEAGVLIDTFSPVRADFLSDK
jgi:quercetin dioxygenase-like cupin family protein